MSHPSGARHFADARPQWGNAHYIVAGASGYWHLQAVAQLVDSFTLDLLEHRLI